MVDIPRGYQGVVLDFKEEVEGSLDMPFDSVYTISDFDDLGGGEYEFELTEKDTGATETRRFQNNS